MNKLILSAILIMIGISSYSQTDTIYYSNDDLDKYNIGKISDYQNGTIDRTIDCMLDGENSPYLRGHVDYRKHVTKAKYER